MRTENYNESKLDLFQIVNFFRRQIKIFATIFILVIAIALVYAITRPTTFESKASIIVGERLFFLQQQVQQQQQQLESSDEIAYRYSDDAVIKPIKNTRIIEVSVVAESAEASTERLNNTIRKIIDSHQKILLEKRGEFIGILNSLSENNVNKIDLLQLIDNASNSSATRQLNPISTKELRYSGLLLIVFGIACLLGLIFALCAALLKDYIERNKGRQH